MLEIAIIEDEEKEAARLGGFLDRFSQGNGVELRHSWHSSAAVQYPFGYGSSYTTFEWSGFQMGVMDENGDMEIQDCEEHRLCGGPGRGAGLPQRPP